MNILRNLAERTYPVELSICPVDSVLKDRDGVRVQEVMTTGHHLLSPATVVVAEVYEV